MQLFIFAPFLKMFECCQGADNPIFVKAIAPIGTTEVGSIDAVDLVLPCLRFHTIGGKYWMMVGDAPNNFA